MEVSHQVAPLPAVARAQPQGLGNRNSKIETGGEAYGNTRLPLSQPSYYPIHQNQN